MILNFFRYFNKFIFLIFFVVVGVVFLVLIVSFIDPLYCTSNENSDIFFLPGSVVDINNVESSNDNLSSNYPVTDYSSVNTLYYENNENMWNYLRNTNIVGPTVEYVNEGNFSSYNNLNREDFVLYSEGSYVSEDMVVRAGNPSVDITTTRAYQGSNNNWVSNSVISSNGAFTDATVHVGDVRSHPVGDALAQNVYLSDEVSVHKQGLVGKVKLGFGTVQSKIVHVYIKYHKIGKRKFYWSLWEQGRNNYESYEDFKRYWDPNTKILKEITKEIKKDVTAEVRNLLDFKNPFGTGVVGGSNRNRIKHRSHRR